MPVQSLRPPKQWLSADLTRSKGFDLLFQSGFLPWLPASVRGCGSIFLLHRVAAPSTKFLARRDVIASDALEAILKTVRELDCRAVAIDQVAALLSDKSSAKPFVCFTFDDGYLDNLRVALPLFRKYQIPLCVYATTGFVARTHEPWWHLLEWAALKSDELIFEDMHGCEVRLPARTEQEKLAAYERASGELFEQKGAAYQQLDRLRARYDIP